MPTRSGQRVTLGIFTAVPEGYQGRWPFGPQTLSFRAVCRAARREGMACIVFTPAGLPARGDPVEGWTWARGAWQPAVARLDVVYNRVPRRSLERRPDVVRALARLGRAGVPVFNPGFFDKAALYRVLAGDPATRDLVAPTVTIDRPRDLERALARWGRVVLKPTDGSLGRKVYFLAGEPGDFACWPGAGGRAGWTGRCRHVRELLERLPSLAVPGRWLAQQEVDRVRVDGRPCDVRALVQRDGSGAWIVTGMAVRAAGPGRLVTHVPQGGSRLPLSRLLQQLDPGTRLAAQAALGDACLKAASAVQRGLGGIWGELSIDLAVGPDGRVWLLECNAKPMRFDEPGIRRRHFRNLARFARALAAGWRPGAEAAAGVVVAGA